MMSAWQVARSRAQEVRWVDVEGSIRHGGSWTKSDTFDGLEDADLRAELDFWHNALLDFAQPLWQNRIDEGRDFSSFAEDNEEFEIHFQDDQVEPLSPYVTKLTGDGYLWRRRDRQRSIYAHESTYSIDVLYDIDLLRGPDCRCGHCVGENIYE